jgi:cytochrome c biogenesis protein CcmG, thiol:disulfide interchange protein DsbE
MRMATWVCLFLAGVMAGCAPKALPPQKEGAIPAERYAAPPFSIPSLTGASDKLSLGSYTGQVVLLDFWATWCPACRWEMPRLDRLYGELKDKGLALIGLVVDDAPPARLAEAVKRFDVSFPVGLAGVDIQAAYGGIRAVPTKFLLDRSGSIRKTYMGAVQPDELRADIEALLTQ